MAACDYCGTTILFGGEQLGSYRFCNQQCASKGSLLQLANQIPAEIVQQEVWKLHQGQCPVCSGPGPIDVHTSYFVYSVLIMTSWQSKPRISCRSCGVKTQLTDTVVSAVVGWWGVPWGFIMTPVQMGRNLLAIIRAPDTAKPSAQLEKMVRTTIAAHLASREHHSANA
jgi:DNA-directed RNA polymerase subunit RPC12/RpoP